MMMASKQVVRVQALAKSGIQTIPPQYISRLETMAIEDSTADLPRIDMSDLNNANTVAQIAKAAQEWGFFQIINHAIPQPLIAKVQAVSQAFFDLPMEQKEVHAADPGLMEGYGSKMANYEDERVDWKDYYYHIVWPLAKRDMSKWPKQPSSYIETIDEYSRGVLKLADRLLQALSLGLGLHEEALNEAVGGTNKEMSFKINYYPPCPQPELAFGVPPHSDPNVLTVLLVDRVPGLQIRKDAKWVNVKCIAGALIVNIGDQLEILSNGKYKSVDHRALLNKEEVRMSLPMFCTPPLFGASWVISPLKELVNEDHPPLYKPLSYQDYIMGLVRQRAYGKAQIQKLKGP